jgi:hypothetical protein
MSLPQSVADHVLGLTASEIQILRQQQQVAAQGHTAQSQAGRGRGQSRSSNPSSRAASAASSQGGQGRVFLDPGSLQRLNAQLEHLMSRIQDRIANVSSCLSVLVLPSLTCRSLSSTRLLNVRFKPAMIELAT